MVNHTPIPFSCSQNEPNAAVWDDLLGEFRALGGIAENLTLREGAHGRGLFAVDPSRPVRLFVPGNLLIPVRETEVREGQLVVRDSAPVGVRERTLFATYHRHFGWGNGGFDAQWREQEEWCGLSDAVRAQVGAMMGAPEDRFLAPTEAICRMRYLNSRAIPHQGTLTLMPFMEIINHDLSGTCYRGEGDGKLVEGHFADEVLVRYGIGDAWSRATLYGFADRTIWGHSLVCGLPAGSLRLVIGRNFRARNESNGVPLPEIERIGDQLIFSFLMIGHRENIELSGALFKEFMSQFGVENADRLFNLIHLFNRSQYLKLLRLLAAEEGGVASMLREAVLNQLDAISAYC